MPPWDLTTLLGARLDDATRIVLLHERSRSFRWLSLFELVLMLFAAIILIPFWIYLLFTSMSLYGDRDGEEDGASDKDSSRAKRRYSGSSFFDYHHDLVLRVFGKDGVELHEARARVRNPDEGSRLVASVLRAAQPKGLIVVESVGEAGQALHDPVHFWYGGRPLMTRPDLRPPEETERRLGELGFELVAEDGRHLLRRVSPPPNLLVALVMLGFVGYVLFLAASIWLLPALLFALFLMRRHLGDFLLQLYCGLFRVKEHQELSVSRSEITYRGGRGWRRARARVATDELFAVGCYGALGYADGVQRQPARLHLVGASSTAKLPAVLTEEAEKLVCDWVTEKVLAVRGEVEVVALRSRCTFCGTLADFGASPTCPACGAPFLGRTG